MRVTILLFILFPLSGFTQSDTLKTFVLEPQQLQQDFSYFRRLLEETHPGLYRYTSVEKMQGKLDSIQQRLDKPLPFYDFYKIILSVVADIRCSHTHALPRDAGSYMSSIKLLPFFVYPAEDKLIVLFNGSTDPNVTLGYELVKINGYAVDSISKIIKRYYWSDGAIELAKNNALQGGPFSLFYYMLIEQPEKFDLIFLDKEGKTYRTTVSAQTNREAQRLYARAPINKAANQFYNKRNKNPWRLDFVKDLPGTAYLRFDGFGGKGMHDGDKARAGMQKFMNESLQKMQSKKIQTLMVDVRSNGGGWDNQGVELFSYLMKQDTGVLYYKRLHAITDSSAFLAYSDLSEEDRKRVKSELRKEPDGTFTLRPEYNPDLLPIAPKPNRFKGDVYILSNEHSFSTTSEFLAACKTYKVGTIVGTEAGGAYGGGNGSSFISLRLPNSKIMVGTPLVYYQNAISDVQPADRGALPDYEVPIEAKDLLTDYDSQLEFVKELIRKKKTP